MDSLVRSFSAVIDDVDTEKREVVAKVSVGDVDRHRTLIESRGINLDNFRRNPVVLFEHGKDPNRGALPIGKCAWIRPDTVGNGRLLAKTRFAKDDFSQMLLEFYRDGTMRGWSIMILPKEASPPSREEIRARPELANCELVYRESDLGEYSAVSVPSCASALSLSELRSLSKLVVGGFWSPDDEVKRILTRADLEKMADSETTERMSESTLADGGALVGDDSDDDDDEEDDKKKKKKRAVDDAEDDSVDMCMKDEETRSVEAETEAETESENDKAVTRDGPPDEPRDKYGKWTDAGSDSSKSEVKLRKSRKRRSDNDERTGKVILTKRDDAMDRLQDKYDKQPLYKTHDIIDKTNGEILHTTVSKNAGHLGWKEEKKYVIKTWGDKSKYELDRETANDLQKAAKIADRMHKSLLSDKSNKLAGRDLDADEIETIERSADEAETVVAETAETVEVEVTQVVEVESVERTVPDAVETVVEPVKEVDPEPAPVVEETKPDLPPLVGRSFDEIVKEAVRSIDDWQKTNTQRIQDLAGWLRGEA